MNKNIYGFADVLASILFIYKDMNVNDVKNKIGSDMKFWVEMGSETADDNRGKVVFEISERYKIGNISYDEINKHIGEIIRPKKEVLKIYNVLIDKFKTLYDLGYLCWSKNEKEIIYIKSIGFDEITLELNVQTHEVKKYVNDFIKKVEVETENIEVILMKNLLQ